MFVVFGEVNGKPIKMACFTELKNAKAYGYKAGNLNPDYEFTESVNGEGQSQWTYDWIEDHEVLIIEAMFNPK